jgi:hypothetical protein
MEMAAPSLVWSHGMLEHAATGLLRSHNMVKKAAPSQLHCHWWTASVFRIADHEFSTYGDVHVTRPSLRETNKHNLAQNSSNRLQTAISSSSPQELLKVVA